MRVTCCQFLSTMTVLMPDLDITSQIRQMSCAINGAKPSVASSSKSKSGLVINARPMLSIGRALMTNPDLLLLDEATEGLAPLIAQDIWRICELIAKSGISSVIVDKNWQHVTRITQRNVILVKGDVVFEGSSDALLAQPDLLNQHLGV